MFTNLNLAAEALLLAYIKIGTLRAQPKNAIETWKTHKLTLSMVDGVNVAKVAPCDDVIFNSWSSPDWKSEWEWHHSWRIRKSQMYIHNQYFKSFPTVWVRRIMMITCPFFVIWRIIIEIVGIIGWRLIGWIQNKHFCQKH